MNILLDTNIIVNLIRSKDFRAIINFVNPENSLLYISVVSEAEIKSLALRNNWGSNKRNLLDSILDQLNIIDVDKSYVNIYAEIDAYSQKSNPTFDDYSFDTARNMGKNDLWIASLAALMGLTLITTDADFDHLNNVFFKVRKINPTEFRAFF